VPHKAKRSAQGGGSIRKRPDGTWEGRFTIGRDPGTGKQVQKSVYGKTQSEVRKKLQAATTAIDNGLYMEPSKMKVGQWIDIWLAEYLGGVKPTTVYSYTAACNVHVKPALGAVKLSALNPHDIQALYNRLQKGTPDGPGLSPKTIKNTHGIIHKALAQAVELGYIKFNPAGACKLPRIEKKKIQPLDDEEITKFLQIIKGHQYETLYLVDLFTGLRQGELLGLTWDCINFDKGTILVDKQLQKERSGSGAYNLVSPKNNKSRTITPAPSIMKALRDHRRQQMEWQLLAGSAWGNDRHLVFTNQLGHNLSAQTVYLHFKKLAEAVGVPTARFHDLRHSYAVAALQSGDDIKTVQENLGHHTAAFTLDTYAHVTEKMKKDSADRMERFISGVKNL
jgi:integrase